MAKADRKMKFTSLVHHINEANLLECYRELKRNKASGIDGVTVEEYGQNLQDRIKDLVQRLKTKQYKPQPVRRVYIPKPGKEESRALGIPALEDKLVQLMVKKLLEAIFEPKFLDCSHGFRPNRSCHTAIAELNKSVMKEPVNYIVEVDIRKFFDTVNHYWLIRCLEERISDPNMIWLIKQFLKSGIMEQGKYQASIEGTPQGGIISPLLANIYLHYVLDLWVQVEVIPKARGKMRLIRYCDDFIVCCENQQDAEQFLEELQIRLKKFNLKVAEDKTKLIKFGRQPWKQWRKGGAKPGSFNFLGFTHYCGTTRKGWFSIKHKTAKDRLRMKLTSTKDWLKRICNMLPLKEWWPTLNAKLLGHYRYYGVSGNYRCINKFYKQTVSMVFKWLNRRSQKRSLIWLNFMKYLSLNPLPKPKIYFDMYTPSPFGNAAMKSPVWENHSQGSVGASIVMKQFNFKEK